MRPKEAAAGCLALGAGGAMIFHEERVGYVVDGDIDAPPPIALRESVPFATVRNNRVDAAHGPQSARSSSPMSSQSLRQCASPHGPGTGSSRAPSLWVRS